MTNNSIYTKDKPRKDSLVDFFDQFGSEDKRIEYFINRACGMLHRIGIRYATVNPRNTSRLAYDGSKRKGILSVYREALAALSVSAE